MEEREKSTRKDELFSKAIRAGKRTYFFDVKETRGEEKYLTITESKRRFNNEQGNFFFEKHKIFLYKEDFEKFIKGLDDSLKFIETGEYPEDYGVEESKQNDSDENVDEWFDTLDKLEDSEK